MSFLKALSARFQKFSATNENHQDDQLRTRYYKASFNQAFQAVEQQLKANPAYRISNVSKDHGEISVEISNPAAFMTVTVVTTKPFETAVDLHISTEKFSLTGINPLLRAELQSFYRKLDQSLPYIGSGIYGNE